ncbi:MAG: hypothetical protein LBV41_07515 [Cytophagaceae bacterium]|jgi:type II secretory pathway component PulJ|nr:hypothetical protein [Cytophagaceae bacterium]
MLRRLLLSIFRIKIIYGDARRTLASAESSMATLAELWQVQNYLRRHLPNFGKCKIICGDTCRTLASAKSSTATLAELWQVQNYLRQLSLYVTSDNNYIIVSFAK